MYKKQELIDECIENLQIKFDLELERCEEYEVTEHEKNRRLNEYREAMKKLKEILDGWNYTSDYYDDRNY